MKTCWNYYIYTTKKPSIIVDSEKYKVCLCRITEEEMAPGHTMGRRQASDVLASVLLGNSGPLIHVNVALQHQPKQWLRTPIHGNSNPEWICFIKNDVPGQTVKMF